MAQGDLTTKGKCNFCGITIAWKQVKSTKGHPERWLLCDARIDENGNIIRVTVKNGKGRTVKRPQPGDAHTCDAVLEGKVRSGEHRPEGLPQRHPVPGDTDCPERLNGVRCIWQIDHWPATKHETPSGSKWPTCPSGLAPETHQEIQPPVLPAEIDYGRIRRELVTILDEYGVKPPPMTIEVKAPEQDPITVKGITHPNLPVLIRYIARRQHGYLFGPAGTGKTFAAGQAAEALGLRSAVVSMPGIQSPSRLFGFETANGKLVETVLFDYWKNGGVLILDEFDRGIPQVNTSLNSCLENGRAVFGGQSHEAHADFVVVGTGNTDMRGATMDYTAAQPQDYSTAKRFAFVAWENDLATEHKLVAAIIGDGPASTLIEFCEALREAIKRAAMDKILCGPRESMRIAEDFKAGTSMVEAFNAWVRCGLDADAWDALLADAGSIPVIEKVIAAPEVTE